MADSLVGNRFSPSSIRSKVQEAVDSASKPESPAAGPGAGSDVADPLPKPGDAYKAAGRHGSKPDLSIHFVLKDYSYEGFSYADFERVRLVTSKKPGSGPLLILRFSGSVVTEVTIEGRHLRPLYFLLGQHRMPWLWEHPSPADFADPDAAVISRITIEAIDG